MSGHAEVDCQAPDCGRLHVGDVVRVVIGPQVGYMMSGEVTVQPDGSVYTVHFPDGAPIESDGQFLGYVNDLNYLESELEKISI